MACALSLNPNAAALVAAGALYPFQGLPMAIRKRHPVPAAPAMAFPAARRFPTACGYIATGGFRPAANRQGKVKNHLALS